MMRLILLALLFFIPLPQEDPCAGLREDTAALANLVAVYANLHRAAQTLHDDPQMLQAAAVALFQARIHASETVYPLVRDAHELLSSLNLNDVTNAASPPAPATLADVEVLIEQATARTRTLLDTCFHDDIPIAPASAPWLREQTALPGCGGPVMAVAFSPDGSALAAGDASGCLTLWDAHTWAMRYRRRGRQAVESVAFRADGALLAAAGADGTVRLWGADGAPRAALAGHTGRVVGVGFAADGTLVSAGLDGTVRFWPREAPTEAAHIAAVEGLTALAVGENLAAAGSASGSIRLWDATTGTELPAPGRQETAVFSLAFDVPRRLLASGDFDTVYLWPLGGGTARPLGGRVALASSLAFGPAETLAVGSAGAVGVWFPGVGAGGPVLLSGHTGVVTGVAFAPDGMAMASAGGDGVVRVWRIPPLARILTEAERLACLVTTADGPANRRAGPGIMYEIVSILESGARVEADAQAAGADGFTWWRLVGGTWVREDVVHAEGGCARLPPVGP